MVVVAVIFGAATPRIRSVLGRTLGSCAVEGSMCQSSHGLPTIQICTNNNCRLHVPLSIPYCWQDHFHIPRMLSPFMTLPLYEVSRSVELTA